MRSPDRSSPTPRRSRRRFAATAALALGVGAISVGGVLGVSAVYAAQIIDVHPGLLQLDISPDDPHFTVHPGDVAYVTVDATLDDEPYGTLTLQLRKDGDLLAVPGTSITVLDCRDAWTGVPLTPTPTGSPKCDNGASQVLRAIDTDQYAASSPTWSVDVITNQRARHLLVAIALPSTPDALNKTGTFALSFTATEAVPPGATPAAGTPHALASTGAAGTSTTSLLAAALVVGGLFALLASAVLRRPQERVR